MDPAMNVLIQLIINGILLGSMYAIVSVGLTLIFGIVRVVNFAHGEFLMVGMYAAYLLSAKFGLHPYVSALPVTVLLCSAGSFSHCFRPMNISRYSPQSDCRSR
jgi:branched-chain amino acid transport system permease protein